MSNKRIPKKSENKEGDYNLVEGPFPFHAREDPTTLPPNTLIAPSQNVINNTANRIQLVKGYTLDGAPSTVIDSGIQSNYDFYPSWTTDVRNMRAGFLSSAGNDGKLQFRYVDASGNISWVNLKTGLTTVNLCFDGNFWDTTNLLKLLTWVDGSNFIYSWNGALALLASSDNTAGHVLTVASTPTAAGTGYSVGDILTITTGGTGATVKVLTLSGSTVATVALVSTGSGYTTGTGKATTGGTGTGATINITAVGTGQITISGTTPVLNKGFYTITSANQGLIINGNTYSYSAVIGNSFIGLNANPTGEAVGSLIMQTYITTALSSMTAISPTFGPTVIGCGRENQIYLGSKNSNYLYISKVNNYTDYSFTTPVRVAGEGDLISMDAPPVKFIAQEVHGDTQSYDMWISTGLNNWSIIRSTLSSDNANEALSFIRLKTAPLQGAVSERLCGKMKNHIIFVGNDNVCNAMGYISYQFVPVMQDLSYPIIDDMNSYDFTNGSIFYHKNYIYVAIPKEGLIRVYNMTNQTNEQYSNYNPQESLDAQQPFYWEAPITYPISGFYVVNGDLYGHGYNTSESYKLFDGGSFNGQDITANASFAFDAKGDRTQSKGSDEIWVEGYIKQNTTLNGSINEDLDSFENSQNFTINGDDNSIVAFGGGGNSLGDTPLGAQPLGGSEFISSSLPAWFHVAKTYPQNSYYLESISFYTKGVDLQWELITWGTNSTFTNEGNNAITQ